MRVSAKVLLVSLCAAASWQRGVSQDAGPSPTIMPAPATPELKERPASGAPAAEPAYMSDPKFQKALAEAKEKGRMTVEERLARWKNANKVSKNQCVECLHEMIVYQFRQAQWKDLIGSANQLDLVATERKEKFFAESERGKALLHTNNDKPKPEQMREAEASLHAALEISPKAKTTLYSEGRALAMLGRDEDAKAIFQRYVDAVEYSDSYRTRAAHFVENPHLAAMPMAPPFTLTTSEGEQISLDDMGGKVVLLDFWATWCGPCRETLPVIQKMAKNFAEQPLVVVSISSDNDERAWRDFIDKNHMTWPQYRDGNGALRRAYGIEAIPQFFTIDTDGVLQSVKVGSNADIEGEIKHLLKKAKVAERALATH